MKGSNFIHCILIWAMCLGQVVANAHVINHIGEHVSAAEHQANHLSAHKHEHLSELLSLEDSGSDDVNSDCGIYHAYAGSAAITPAVCNAIAIEQRRTLVISYYDSNFYTELADTQPIRGPPTHS